MNCCSLQPTVAAEFIVEEENLGLFVSTSDASGTVGSVLEVSLQSMGSELCPVNRN